MISRKNILRGAATVLCGLAVLFPSSAEAQIQFEQIIPMPPAPEINPNISAVREGDLAFADIDGDNDDDVLITGRIGALGYVSELYINDGSGNYSLATNTPFTGIYQSSIAFADIDGDSDQDVLITGRSSVYSDGAVSELYTNDGNGNFTFQSDTPFLSVLEGSVAFADIDGDSDQDVLITGIHNNSDLVSVLYINDGSGNFSLVENTPFTGVFRSSIAFADVDGDNDQDVLVTGRIYLNGISELYINDGSGNYFLAPNTPFTSVYDSSIAFADIDGDSDQDVLITGLNNGYDNAESELYINDGSGNYSLLTNTPFSDVREGSVAFADIDGDSDQDVLITGMSSSNLRVAELYNNNGYGNFSLVANTTFPDVYDSAIGFADIDGDSDQDVLITGFGTEEVTELFTNDGSGNFSVKNNLTFTTVVDGEVTFVDIDSDTDQDIVLRGQTSSGYIEELYTNDGSGVYSLVTNTIFSDPLSKFVAFADFNGDSTQDILMQGGAYDIYTNDGNGTFSPLPGTPFINNNYAAVDVDGDNDVDVFSVTTYGWLVNTSKLYINDGTGNFSFFTDNTEIDNEFIRGSTAYADIDGDNDLDILISGLYYTPDDQYYIGIKLYINYGNYYSLEPSTPFNEVVDCSIAFADIDGDSDQDVLIVGGTYYGNIAELYTNDGSGNFSLMPNTPFPGVRDCAVAFIDIDGDNDQDIFISGDGISGKISELYTNDGTGSYSLVPNMPFIGVDHSCVAFADVDGDMDQDVLITGSGNGNDITVLYRNTSIIPCQITTSCQPFTLELDESGNATLLDSDIDNGSTVSCGEPILSISQSAFTCLDAGEQEVELTVSNEDGDFETCTAVVTVVPSPVCFDCYGELNGDAFPGSICFNDEGEGVFDADCNCVSNNMVSIDGHVEWLSDCGSRNITVELYNQTFPDLNQVYSISIDENGDFNVPAFEVGTYDILITVEGYLSQLYTDVLFESGMNELEVSGIIAGDLNESNGVNISDFSILNNAFGSSEGDVNYNLFADFNCDGAVTIIDISILNIAFGMVGDSLPED